ncbi:hypothetical protein ACFL3J_02685 [Candidatus Omnitrophota bacterium]
MKTKFEKNVASEKPKTKSQEPGLPWKISSEDLAGIKAPASGSGISAAEISPLKARAPFMIALILVIFAASLMLIADTTVENDTMRADIMQNEKQISTLITDVDKVTTEKSFLAADVTRMEKEVNDLSAQKELFTTVIESLTTKSGTEETSEVGWRQALDG